MGTEIQVKVKLRNMYVCVWWVGLYIELKTLPISKKRENCIEKQTGGIFIIMILKLHQLSDLITHEIPH